MWVKECVCTYVQRTCALLMNILCKPQLSYALIGISMWPVHFLMFLLHYFWVFHVIYLHLHHHPRSCFPTTIITRVLNCGLKDFCNVGKGLSDRDPGARKKIPKMASVVGILGHLASKHRQDIRKALMALFEVCRVIFFDLKLSQFTASETCISATFCTIVKRVLEGLLFIFN